MLIHAIVLGAEITTHKSDYELVVPLDLCSPHFCWDLKRICIVSQNFTIIKNVAVKILVADTFLNLIIYYVLLINFSPKTLAGGIEYEFLKCMRTCALSQRSINFPAC
jgi:hypothetical protein